MKLVLSPLSLLLLDEPTNHLDIPAQGVVAGALNSYKGTAVIVSHDRYFLDSVANKILGFKDGELIMYSGNYTNYRALAESGRFDKPREGGIPYIVEKKFTDWSTGRRYAPGEDVKVTEDMYRNFQWAINTGRMISKDKEETEGRRKKR